LIEDIDDELDPILDPILDKQFLLDDEGVLYLMLSGEKVLINPKTPE
jgi:hypothetical protein